MSVDGGTPLTRVNPAPGSPSVQGVGDRRGHRPGDGKREEATKKEPEENEEPVDEESAAAEPDADEAERLDITA